MYYTYYSYETDKGIDGLGYIGYRKLKNADTPEEEDYFGTPSSPKNKKFKENKNKAKIILGRFKIEQEAIVHEIYLHELWAVDTNPHFANQVRQTSTGFRASLAGIGSSHPSCDHTLRDWTNDKLGITEYSITTYDLQKKYPNLSLNALRQVIKGHSKTSGGGWRLC